MVAADRELNVKRMLVGTIVSSLDMAGVSISVMHLTDDVCSLLDAPTEAPAWPRVVSCPQIKPRQPLSAQSSMAAQERLNSASAAASSGTSESHVLVRVLRSCANACIAAEPELTRQDRISGDGDCGQTIKQGAEGIIAVLPSLRLDDLGAAAAQLATAVEKSMGGTSGAALQYATVWHYFMRRRAFCSFAVTTKCAFKYPAIHQAAPLGVGSSMVIHQYTKVCLLYTSPSPRD